MPLRFCVFSESCLYFFCLVFHIFYKKKKKKQKRKQEKKKILAFLSYLLILITLWTLERTAFKSSLLGMLWARYFFGHLIVEMGIIYYLRVGRSASLVCFFFNFARTISPHTHTHTHTYVALLKCVQINRCLCFDFFLCKNKQKSSLFFYPFCVCFCSKKTNDIRFLLLICLIAVIVW